jgi:hypothetical protein
LAAAALIEELAAVGGHGFLLAKTTLRAGYDRVKLDVVHITPVVT